MRMVHVGAWMGIALLALVSAARGDDESEAGRAGQRTQLAFEGKAAFRELGFLGQQEFRFDLVVKNRAELPLEIRAANLLLAHRGGWLAPLDPDTLDGSYFRGPLVVQGGEQRAVAGQRYRAGTPATHAVLTVEAEDGHAAVVVPILREGFAAPQGRPIPHPFGIGLVAPLHLVPFADGRASILLVGQHQFLGGHAPAGVHTRIQVGGDAGATEPVEWEGVDAEGDRVALWPFVRRLSVFDGFERGMLRVHARATIDGREVEFDGSWPVKRIEPVPLLAPVVGSWQLSNGPGRKTFSDHYALPQRRYSYDLVVLEQGRTHRGDPHRNESYFAWNRSVRAAADGEVVDVCDRERDNPGYRGALTQCGVNRVVLKHANGVYTAYTHLRQRSAVQRVLLGSRVRAGQVIARVGNSGDSSEPHLHFTAYRVDETGRVESLPVTFTNAFADARSATPIGGVPLGGQIYDFRGP